jgi:hypothetical protein
VEHKQYLLLHCAVAQHPTADDLIRKIDAHYPCRRVLNTHVWLDVHGEERAAAAIQ